MIARVLLALLLLALMPRAWAASGVYADQGSAYAACTADVKVWQTSRGSTARNAVCYLNSPTVYLQRAECFNGQWGTCNPGLGSYSFPAAGTCSSRPVLGAAQSKASGGSGGAICSNGCTFQPQGDSVSIQLGNGPVYSQAGNWKATGATCSPGDGTGDPLTAQEDCTQQGTLTQCVRSDGKTCATASTGKQFCWQQGENGVKTADNGNQAATKSPANTQINAPKTPPANGGDWTVTGQGTVTETKGGTASTSNVTTFDSSYGKNGTGKGDGTGSGSSSGGGTGDGDGEGDGDGDGNDPGGVGEGLGDLYTDSDLTLTGLVSEYYGKVSETPFLGSIKSFVTVNGGGSCPVFTMPATQWNNAMTLDSHCSGAFLAALQACGWVLFGIASYFAVRIAVN